MITIKTEKEIQFLREGGRLLADIVEKLTKKVAPGMTTRELDQHARAFIKAVGGKPAFLHYQPDGASYPYPAALCVSVNNEVVHGIPSDRIIVDGDIVSIDLGLKYKNLFTDHARTIAVGKVSKEIQKLLLVGEKALTLGIREARVGNTVGDIGAAIEAYVAPYKYGIVRELAGHGVGREVHEDPYVPNYGKQGKGEKLIAGMVIAIEPMINQGGKEVIFDKDEYTVRTKDGKRSVHFEHTVLITNSEPEVLTALT